MTLNDFIKKWDGKGIDFDGYYGDQCMDLMHQYHVEVLGITDGRTLAAPSAKDVYLLFSTRFNHELFEKIPNTPTGVPEAGDIVLWGTGIGPYGHVAIFVEGDANKFTSFDQNFPTGSKCHKQSHDYTGVLGWLRFIKEDDCEEKINKLEEEVDGLRASRDSWRNKYDEETKKLSEEIATWKKNYETMQETNATFSQTITDLQQENQRLNNDVSTCQSKRDELQNGIDSLLNEKRALESNIGVLQLRISELEALVKEEKAKVKTKIMSFTWWERFSSLFRRG